MHPINIYLVRHGQSTGNGKGQFGQDITAELTELGKSQAQKLANRFIKDNIVFDRAVSSSYVRAADTARIIVAAIDHKEPLYMTSALVEYSPGKWRGKKISEVMSDPKQITPLANLAMWYRFPGGDSLIEVQGRAVSYLQDYVLHEPKVLEAAGKAPVNVLIVSHGHVIRTLLQSIMSFDQSFMWKLDIDNCCINHLVYSDRGWNVKSINDTAHLRD